MNKCALCKKEINENEIVFSEEDLKGEVVPVCNDCHSKGIKDEDNIFWRGPTTVGKGGIYYRDELPKFIKKVENNTGKKVVGIRIDDERQLELILGV